MPGKSLFCGRLRNAADADLTLWHQKLRSYRRGLLFCQRRSYGLPQGKSADPQHLSRCPENGSKNGQYVYTVRIHIRGNYIVGRYATDIEAAIAYNKAIDILHSKGVTSNFTPNYVEAITPRRYAEIYSTLDIAPGILNYEPISPNNQ